MYKDFEGKSVSVYVASRSEYILQYDGIVEKADHQLIMSGVTISILTHQLGRNVFGQGNSLFTIAQNVPKLAINQDYIISLNAR